MSRCKAHPIVFNFFSILLISIIATIGMDLWNVVLYYWAGDTLDWHMVGRWFGHIIQGDFIFRNIPQSAPIAHEAGLGWLAHYTIGFVYTFIYCFIILFVLQKKPSWYSALIFSWIIMISPFLILQPAMGMGFAASLTSTPWINRLTTLSFHSVFGLSLYLGCIFVRALLKRFPFESKSMLK